MTRRWGNLGVGALLSLSLATGCVTTGGGSTEPTRTDNAVAPPTHPVLPAINTPVMLQVVTAGLPDERLARIEPPPPPPEILPVGTFKQTPLQPMQSEHVALAPMESKETPLLTALRGAIEKHPTEVFDALQKYDKRTQEVLLAILPLAARLSEGGLEKASPQEREALVEQLNQAIAALHVKMPLRVQKARFCRRIWGFGLYDPLPDDHPFLGGVDKKHGELVELYVEASHFANRRNGEFYEVSLAGQLEIHDTQGKLVWRHAFPASPDHSLDPRQDYFINYWFWVPPLLEPGEYKLTISLADDNAPGDATVRTLPFHIVSGATARSGNGSAR